jgi:hypothetical protein
MKEAEASQTNRVLGSVPRRATLLAAGILACLVLACSPTGDQSSATRRALDAEPVTVRLATPLPAGRAEAFFKLDTGGDQMTQRPKEAGLVVVVRVESNEYRQTIASCVDPGLGSALGGGTERELEVAVCDGEYWLVSEPGIVSVVRMDKKPDGEQVARFDLPDGVRAVQPPDR